ncbi:MAG: hypothetical protein DI528_08990 [Shinella sp.]|nr:MAG: hypothetical protein DI528_08990 [Shinella sp.]
MGALPALASHPRQRLPLTLTLSPQAGRGNGDDVVCGPFRICGWNGAARLVAFSPQAGRRCRQADEGRPNVSPLQADDHLSHPTGDIHDLYPDRAARGRAGDAGRGEGASQGRCR